MVFPDAQMDYDYHDKRMPGKAKAQGLGPSRARRRRLVSTQPSARQPVSLSVQETEVDRRGLHEAPSPEIKFHARKPRRWKVYTQVQYLADRPMPGSPGPRLDRAVGESRGKDAVNLTGTSATIEYSTVTSPRGIVPPPRELEPGEKKIWFNDLPARSTRPTVIPPANFNGWPVMPAEKSFTAVARVRRDTGRYGHRSSSKWSRDRRTRLRPWTAGCVENVNLKISDPA